VYGNNGYTQDAIKVANMGDAVTLWVSDPSVQGGKKIAKLMGRVTGRSIRPSSSGTVLQVTGADLGWHLSSCGEAIRSLRGLTWLQFAAKMLGLTLNPSTGEVTNDAYQWGFQGIGTSNVLGRKLKLGRQEEDIEFQQRTSTPQIILPRIQVEIGQTLDSLLIQYARLDGYLVNVSADGWLQIFKPASGDGVTAYSAQPLYTFTHPGNILKDTLDFEESADGLYTHVECHNTVIDTVLQDSINQNAGRYHGQFDPAIGERPFAFERRYTFSDPEQYGGEPSNPDGSTVSGGRVKARAKWQWQRFMFDAQTITFEVQGHAQNGVPYVEDSLCSFKSEVLGLDGIYYIAAIEYSRKLARRGFDSGAGTRTKLTLKPTGLLAA
jgi:hypothetical protein